MTRGPSRVDVTPAAAELIRSLRGAHGPLMFHQSGGCCDGSSPMCYLEGEFRTGSSDVLLESLRIDGVAEPVTFWMSRSQGVRFLIRSRLLTSAELAALE
jgi:uncharacterized protein (DUF779 family)